MSNDPTDSNRIENTSDRALFNMLRRLQEHTRSNVPAMMAQRSMSSFTLHEESIPDEALNQVRVVVYPQDPFVGEPDIRLINAKDIRPGLINARVRIQDDRGLLAQPDDDGNYLYLPGSIEFDQVSAFYYTTFVLRMYERYARRAIPWAFPAQRITVNPYVGDLANAFYDEQHQLLGFHSYLPPDGELVSTAQSADIVSHEAAHAVLDGVRDFYNESFGLGPRAFHESFGDMTAVLVALYDDALVRRLLEWTHGDLRVSNFVTEVAEHLAELLRTGGEYRSEHTLYLRNAFNQFKDVPFDKLPYQHNPNGSGLERREHSYSRLFTGAFYDILIGVYEHAKETMPSFIAVNQARDILGHLLICAIELGPVGEFDFRDMARAFLTADQILYNGKYQSIVKDVFSGRNILTLEQADAHLQALETLPDIRLPQAMNTWLAASQFLEDMIQPALNLKLETELVPAATYRNAEGNVFMTYFSSRNIRLDGTQYKQFDGTSVDAFGGLTLMFDAADRLRSVVYHPVTDEDVRQIRILTADLIAAGTIVDSLHPEHPGKLRLPPQGVWIPESLPGKTRKSVSKLVKYPGNFDPIEEEILDLRNYLQAITDVPDTS